MSNGGLTNDQFALAKALASQQRNSREYRQSWLYDSSTVTSASTTEANFFQVPYGQSSKTLADTNLTTGGELPSGRQFVIKSMVVQAFPTSSTVLIADDLRLLFNGSYGSLIINDKPTPDHIALRMLAGGAQIVGAGSTTQCWMGNGNVGNVLPFQEPFLISIDKGTPFRFEARWPTAIAISVSIRLTVVLYGRGTR